MEREVALAMKEEYTETDAGFRAIAKKYGLTYYAVQLLAREEGWLEARAKYRAGGNCRTDETFGESEKEAEPGNSGPDGQLTAAEESAGKTPHGDGMAQSTECEHVRQDMLSMKQEYAGTNMGFRAVARKYGLTYYGVQLRAKEEGWIEARAVCRMEKGASIHPAQDCKRSGASEISESEEEQAGSTKRAAQREKEIVGNGWNSVGRAFCDLAKIICRQTEALSKQTAVLDKQTAVLSKLQSAMKAKNTGKKIAADTEKRKAESPGGNRGAMEAAGVIELAEVLEESASME